MAQTLHAESGYDAWLRYAALDDIAARQYRAAIPGTITAFNEPSAQQELIRGIRGMLGRTLRVEPRVGTEAAIILGTLDELKAHTPQFSPMASLDPDAYWLKTVRINGVRHIVVT